MTSRLFILKPTKTFDELLCEVYGENIIGCINDPLYYIKNFTEKYFLYQFIYYKPYTVWGSAGNLIKRSNLKFL